MFSYPIISHSLQLVKPAACGLALSSYSSSRTGNLRQVTCCLVKQRWLAPVRRPLTFSATSSGQFYLTPDPIVTSRSRMLAIGPGLKGSVIIMAHDPGAETLFTVPPFLILVKTIIKLNRFIRSPDPVICYGDKGADGA